MPRVWAELRQSVPGWPQQKLGRLSFRPPPRRVTWADMPKSFVEDAEAYLALRKDPDLFDDRPWMPQKPLEPNTVRLHRELIQSAFSALVAAGIPITGVNRLGDLVSVDSFKRILRHFHEKADGKPSAFLDSLARALLQIAKYHVGPAGDDLQRLRNLVSKLPKVPADLTEKNKTLIRQFESKEVRAKLLFLPERLLKLVAASLNAPRLPLVMAQAALAVDVLLVAPIRPENLCNLVWQQHLSEPNGPNGPLLLHLTAEETKNKRAYTTELDPDVARRLRWYRNEMLPRLRADLNGPLCVEGRPHEVSGDHQPADHRGTRQACRHPHDAASVPARCGYFLSGGARRRLRDGAQPAQPCFEQIDAHLRFWPSTKQIKKEPALCHGSGTGSCSFGGCGGPHPPIPNTDIRGQKPPT